MLSTKKIKYKGHYCKFLIKYSLNATQGNVKRSETAQYKVLQYSSKRNKAFIILPRVEKTCCFKVNIFFLNFISDIFLQY